MARCLGGPSFKLNHLPEFLFRLSFYPYQADQDINAVKSKIQEQRALIEERKNEISEQRSLEKQTIKEIKESEQNVKIVEVQITKQAEQNRHENVEREKMLTDHDWIEKGIY